MIRFEPQLASLARLMARPRVGLHSFGLFHVYGYFYAFSHALGDRAIVFKDI
jgi:hypothetical protein